MTLLGHLESIIDKLESDKQLLLQENNKLKTEIEQLKKNK